jgi:hypothetical protein
MKKHVVARLLERLIYKFYIQITFILNFIVLLLLSNILFKAIKEYTNLIILNHNNYQVDKE